MNLIGVCVVAGNVRRTAQIALGHAENAEYRRLKDYTWDNASQQYIGSNADRPCGLGFQQQRVGQQ